MAVFSNEVLSEVWYLDYCFYKDGCNDVYIDLGNEDTMFSVMLEEEEAQELYEFLKGVFKEE